MNDYQREKKAKRKQLKKQWRKIDKRLGLSRKDSGIKRVYLKRCKAIKNIVGYKETKQPKRSS